MHHLYTNIALALVRFRGLHLTKHFSDITIKPRDMHHGLLW